MTNAVCGGTGIPAGDCDCDGNQNDALGICGGSCEADVDADGICMMQIAAPTCQPVVEVTRPTDVGSMTNAVCAAAQAFLLVTAIVMATKTMRVSAVAHARPTSMRMLCDGADNYRRVNLW